MLAAGPERALRLRRRRANFTWITAQGPYEGNKALLDVTVTSGGEFDRSDPPTVNSEPGTVGTMEVEFESCTRGVVRYDLPGLGLVGEVPIQRLAEDNVPLCEALDMP